MSRTVTALNRLLDVISLLSADVRIQLVFSLDDGRPAMFGAGTDRLLAELQVRTLPWRDARRTRFDLALSASENDGLDELNAPVFLFSHGAGFQKYYPGSEVVAGLDPRRLVAEGGVVPAAIGLSHPEQRRHLPAALVTRTAVVGDPSLGRMLASRHRRGAYRAALDAVGRRLVVIATTWGPDSLLGRLPQLPEWLVTQLPADEYRVVAVLHPGVWAAHGPWQVREWLARARAAGVRVIAPDAGWQAVLVAADCVLADHGSLGIYGACNDTPILLGPQGSDTTVPGSESAALAARCARLDPYGDLRAQVDAAIDGFRPGGHGRAIADAVEVSAAAAARLRRRLYELLALSEPPMPAGFPPIPVPAPEPVTVAAWVAGVVADGDTVTVTRYPDVGAGPAHDELPYRHVVARVDHADLTQVGAAAVLCGDSVTDDDLLRCWPHAVLVAEARDGGCRVRTRAGDDVLLRTRGRTVVDPWVLASWAYWRVCRDEPLAGSARLRSGRTVVTVVAEAW